MMMAFQKVLEFENNFCDLILSARQFQSKQKYLRSSHCRYFLFFQVRVCVSIFRHSKLQFAKFFHLTNKKTARRRFLCRFFGRRGFLLHLSEKFSCQTFGVWSPRNLPPRKIFLNFSVILFQFRIFVKNFCIFYVAIKSFVADMLKCHD